LRWARATWLSKHGAEQQAFDLVPDDPWITYRLAKRMAQAGQAARGSELFDAAPVTPDMDYAHALYLAGIDATDAAAGVLARVPEAARSEGARELATRIARRMQERAVARAGMLSASLQWRHKPGDAGFSRYDGQVLPVEWRLPGDGISHWSLRADAVHLDAGRLPSDPAAAALFGQVLLGGPAAALPARWLDSRQDGLALGAIWENRTLRADLGTTPLGFLVRNWVGGVRWAPDLPGIDVSAALARRPVTSSVLSYAGRRDPLTGQAWGGVLDTGLSLQAGRYLERHSLAAGLHLSRLAGRDVPGNDYAALRIAGDTRWYASGGLRAYVGATLNFWHYQRNLLNYSFGQGGYYSPQSYFNVGVPVELLGDYGTWSFRLRLTPNYSHSRSDEADFYPGHPLLQQAALAAALPPGYSQPVYGGGSSSGTGVSFYAAFERRIAASLVLGAALDVDRSDYYHPTGFTIYVRHLIGVRPTPVAAPPRPLAPYSDL
jgi:hypothetical protein